MIRSFVLWVVLALVLLASPVLAASDEVVIASGVRGGTYHGIYGPNLVRLLPAFKARQQPTEGSGENLDLLARGLADVGFAQVDVYAARMRENRARYENIGIVGRLADECVYIAYRKGGPIVSSDSFKTKIGDRKPILAVGKMNGGMHGTWLSVKDRVPAFDQTAIRFTAGTLAINHLAAGMLDAVAWITDPVNEDHILLRAVKADDTPGLIGLAEPTLPDTLPTLPNGAAVYESRVIPMSGGIRPETIDTICTSSVIFTRPGADPHLVDAISDVLSLEREKLVNRH